MFRTFPWRALPTSILLTTSVGSCDLRFRNIPPLGRDVPATYRRSGLPTVESPKTISESTFLFSISMSRSLIKNMPWSQDARIVYYHWERSAMTNRSVEGSKELVLPCGNQWLLKGGPEEPFLSRPAMTPLQLALQSSFLRSM